MLSFGLQRHKLRHDQLNHAVALSHTHHAPLPIPHAPARRPSHDLPHLWYPSFIQPPPRLPNWQPNYLYHLAVPDP